MCSQATGRHKHLHISDNEVGAIPTTQTRKEAALTRLRAPPVTGARHGGHTLSGSIHTKCLGPEDTHRTEHRLSHQGRHTGNDC